jgi:hypothetical protein
MKKLTYVIAILAAASTAAVAKDLKQDKKTSVSAKQMSDADMDKVTAGAGYGPTTIYVPGNAAYRTNNAIYSHGASAPFLSPL